MGTSSVKSATTMESSSAQSCPTMESNAPKFPPPMGSSPPQSTYMMGAGPSQFGSTVELNAHTLVLHNMANQVADLRAENGRLKTEMDHALKQHLMTEREKNALLTENNRLLHRLMEDREAKVKDPNEADRKQMSGDGIGEEFQASVCHSNQLMSI